MTFYYSPFCKRSLNSGISITWDVLLIPYFAFPMPKIKCLSVFRKITNCPYSSEWFALMCLLLKPVETIALSLSQFIRPGQFRVNNKCDEKISHFTKSVLTILTFAYQFDNHDNSS